MNQAYDLFRFSSKHMLVSELKQSIRALGL